MKTGEKLAAGSILVGLAVLALKLAAWWITGSVALLSDALESIVNVVAALAAFIAVRFAARPADANHPYGHYKAEYFSAGLEGALIAVAAFAIFREAYDAILEPRALPAIGLGLAVNFAASAANGAWAMVLIRAGKRLSSPALAADGRHLWADVLTSLGVIVGILAAAATGYWILDPLIAIAVAAHILWSGWQLVRTSVDGLMDHAVPAHEAREIDALIAANATGAIEAHDIRTRRAGPVTFVDFHLVVPSRMSVTDAHDICDRIETGLKARLGRAVISIHVEPENKAKHAGILMD